MIGFVIGFIVGVFFGIFNVCLLLAGKNDGEEWM